MSPNDVPHRCLNSLTGEVVLVSLPPHRQTRPGCPLLTSRMRGPATPVVPPSHNQIFIDALGTWRGYA